MRKTVLMCLFFAAPALASNVALGGVAYQSSNPYGWGPELAIDGNTCGDFSCGSTTHTDLDSPAWWYVDLLSTYVLSEIDIWNRTDCCGSRLHDFHVGVYDGSWSEVWGGDYFTTGGLYPNPEYSITLPQGTAGEFVKIYLHNPDYLSLAEVQVWDAGVPEPATFVLIGLSALALGVLRRR